MKHTDLCWDGFCLWYCSGIGTFSLIPGLQIVKAERAKVMFAIVLVFYAWISINFFTVPHFCLPFLCQIFLVLNKVVFDELDFAVFKGREIRLFTKLLDCCFSISEISMLCMQLIQSLGRPSL